MTTDKPAILTPDELAALLDVALGMSSKVPAIRLAKLAVLRYVEMTPNGPVVTGDGLIHLTENGPCGPEDPA